MTVSHSSLCQIAETVFLHATNFREVKNSVLFLAAFCCRNVQVPSVVNCGWIVTVSISTC